MKLPDLGPFTLLCTGLISGVLLGLLFFPEFVGIPEGWGDILGSIFGVAGAFYVARLSFYLELKSRTEHANRPLYNLAVVGIDAVNRATITISEMEEQTSLVAGSFRSFIKNQDMHDLSRLHKSSLRNAISLDDEVLFESIEESYREVAFQAAKVADHFSAKNIDEHIELAKDTVNAIQINYQHLLNHDEIIEVRRLGSVLSRLPQQYERVSQFLRELAMWNPTQRAPNQGLVGILLCSHLTSQRNTLTTSAIILFRIKVRLETAKLLPA
ncbi:MAG: hypothetical protein AXW12_04250 [Thalassospira sp. Nap_22]|nr:MAG: hypothetical protein AXW12_04250 [Thalassospira sp. Nap_22]